MLPKVIAIDGPAGSGKTVIGKRVADALGYLYLDTGAFYRALTWLALTSGIDPQDGPSLARLATSPGDSQRAPGGGRRLAVHRAGKRAGRDPELSEPAVAQRVSIVAAHPEVRAVLLPLQRQAAHQGRVVMAGRDIGTIVFPFAELKLYLKAPLPVRVARRIEQLEAMGMKPDPALVAAEMAERDRLDQARATAPLKPAPDAMLVDTTSLTIDEEVAMILDIITQRSKRA